MAQIYLEYTEEPLETLSMNDLLNEDQESEKDHSEHIMFMPSFLYRNPIDGGVELEVPFPLENINQLHLVIVRYSSTDEMGTTYGKWEIYQVCKTRREATEISRSLEFDKSTWENKVWTNEGCEFESADVVTLNVED